MSEKTYKRKNPKRGRSLAPEEVQHFKEMALNLNLRHGWSWSKIAEVSGYSNSNAAKRVTTNEKGSYFHYVKLADAYARKVGLKKELLPNGPEAEILGRNDQPLAPADEASPNGVMRQPVVEAPTPPPVDLAQSSDPYAWMDEVQLLLTNLASGIEEKGSKVPAPFRGPYEHFAERLLGLAAEFDRTPENGDH